MIFVENNLTRHFASRQLKMWHLLMNYYSPVWETSLSLTSYEETFVVYFI